MNETKCFAYTTTTQKRNRTHLKHDPRKAHFFYFEYEPKPEPYVPKLTPSDLKRREEDDYKQNIPLSITFQRVSKVKVTPT